jgi:hypothetical protein
VNTQLLHTPQLLHLADATLCESDSFYLLTYYKESFPLNVEYIAAEHSLSKVISYAKIFSTFHGRVKVGKTSSSTISSSVPIDVFRYKMLEDGSWYYMKTIPSSHKDGYIVEGAIWSNGMYYVVREDKSSDFIDAYFSVDQYTKGLYNYP